jgi:hypothetical protein
LSRRWTRRRASSTTIRAAPPKSIWRTRIKDEFGSAVHGIGAFADFMAGTDRLGISPENIADMGSVSAPLMTALGLEPGEYVRSDDPKRGFG